LFNRNNPDDKYGYRQYNLYLEKKKKDTFKAEADYNEALNIFTEAKALLEKTE